MNIQTRALYFFFFFPFGGCYKKIKKESWTPYNRSFFPPFYILRGFPLLGLPIVF